jgi:hypothetical protein
MGNTIARNTVADIEFDVSGDKLPSFYRTDAETQKRLTPGKSSILYDLKDSANIGSPFGNSGNVNLQTYVPSVGAIFQVAYDQESCTSATNCSLGQSKIRYELPGNVFSAWVSTKGDVGPPGPPGPPGPAGADSTVAGQRGPTGPTGSTGSTGPTGPTGPTGSASTVAGPTGPTGPVSTVAGPTGPTGPTGSASTVAGPTGPTGPASTVAGPTGPTGSASTVAGPTGPTGPVSTVAGPPGAASTVPGPVGPIGPIGPTGPAGVTTLAGSTSTFTLNPTNTVLTLGNTQYKIDNRGLINMDKIYANQITTSASDAVAGVWLSNHNTGTLTLKADTGVFNSDIINSTIAPYQSLVIAGNRSAGGARKIQLYDDVSIPLGNLSLSKNSSSICAGSFCIGGNMTNDLSEAVDGVSQLPNFSNIGGVFDYPPSYFSNLPLKTAVYYHVFSSTSPDNTNINYNLTKTFKPLGSNYYRQICHPWDIVYNISNCQVRNENTDGQWDPWLPVTLLPANKTNFIDKVILGCNTDAPTYSAVISSTTAAKGTNNSYQLKLKDALKIANSTPAIKAFVYQPYTPSLPAIPAGVNVNKLHFIGDGGNNIGTAWFLGSVPANVNIRPLPTAASTTAVNASTFLNFYYKSGNKVSPLSSNYNELNQMV